MHRTRTFHPTSMNLNLKFLLLFLIAGNFASAQKNPVVKVYAFIQPSLTGIKKTVIAQENGNAIEASSPQKVNYFFYLERKKSEPIRIVGVWMRGKKYITKVDNVSSTPIELTKEVSSNEPDKISLTPDNGNEFLQILPGAETTKGTKLPRGLKRMVQQSELVVIYIWNGKTWYLPVKKVKKLSPSVSE